MFAAVIEFLATIPAMIVTYLTRPPAPVPGSSPNATVALEKLILSSTEVLGPMPGTGGVIHAVSTAGAATIATLIVKYAAFYKVKVSDVAALIRGESDFDDEAKDPNDQDAKPGETLAMAALHMDLGLAQEDVSVAIGDPANAGLSLAQIEQKLLDPEQATIFVCSTLAKLFAWARLQFAQNPSLVESVPNGDSRVLAFQAYNSGPNGSLNIARKLGPAAVHWRYGLGVEARAASYVPIVDIGG